MTVLVFLSFCRLSAASIEDSDSFPVEPASLDLMRIERFSVPEMGTGLRLEFRGPADVAAVRILLNTGSAHAEETTGADFLIEGGRGYRYPDDGVGWAWNEARTPVCTASGNILTVLLPAEAGQVISWAVETITPEWNLADRYPESGLAPDPSADWPPLEVSARTLPEDLSDWYEERPATLSFLLDAQLKNRSWEKMETSSVSPMSMGLSRFGPRELRYMLEDAVSRKSVVLTPAQVSKCGTARLLSGRDLDVDWNIMLDPVEQEGLRITAQCSADRQRALRFSVAMPVQGQAVSLPLVDAPYALSQEADGMLSIETPPLEARRERVFCLPDGPGLGVAWSFGLTPATSNFPGRASFRATFHQTPISDRPLRTFLSGWYPRHLNVEPAAFLQATNAAAVANENWPRMNPFSYSVSLPPDTERDAGSARQSLGALAVLGGDWAADQAQAALHASVRDLNGDVPVVFAGAYAKPSLVLETCPDLEYPVEVNRPLTPAMAAHRLLRFSEDEGGSVPGVILTGMDMAFHGNADAEALAVADYPAVFDGTYAPVLSPEAMHMEFTVPFVAAMRKRGTPVAVAFRDPQQLTRWPNADLAVYRTAQALSFSDAQALRMAAGRRSVLVEFPSTLDAQAVEQTLLACRLYGLMPRFEDAARVATEALRDTQLLVQAPAQAGWLAAPALRCSASPIQVEAFGVGTAPRYLMLHNPTDRKETVKVHLLNEAAPILVLDPLTGWTAWWQPGQPLTVELDPGGVRRLDVIRRTAWSDEETEILALDPITKFGQKTCDMLTAIRGEAEAGFYCDVSFASSIPSDEVGAVSLRVLNMAKAAIELQDAKVIGAARYRPFSVSGAAIAPKRSAQVSGELRFDDSGGNPVYEVQWALVTAKGRLNTQRFIRPDFVAGISITAVRKTVLAPGDLAFVEFDVLNHATRLRTLNFNWSGDFDKGTVERVFGPGSLRRIRIPVMAGKRTSGEVTVRVEDDVFRHEDTVFVRFLPRSWGVLYESGVQLSASSTGTGYRLSDLTDGLLRNGLSAGRPGAWAAAEFAGTHWVQARFDEPKTAEVVRAFWIEEDGRIWAPRKVSVKGLQENGTWVEAEWTKNTLEGAAEYRLPKARYTAVNMQQAPGEGPVDRPLFFGLAEWQVE